jgi:hypothetical protein
MNAIRDLIGQQELETALRRFFATQSGSARSPDARDLIQSITEQATPAERALIEEWTDGVWFYDNALRAAEVTPRGDGTFDVRVTVHTSRSVIRQRQEISQPMREVLALALYSGNPADLLPAKRLSATRHLLSSGETVLTVRTAERPPLAVLDPMVTRIDRNRADNRMVIREK